MACVTLPLAALKKALAATSPTPVQATWRSEEHTSELQSQSISYAVSLDRKSTRLNSSHSQISYAVFCLKKKNNKNKNNMYDSNPEILEQAPPAHKNQRLHSHNHYDYSTRV